MYSSLHYSVTHGSLLLAMVSGQKSTLIVTLVVMIELKSV